LIESVVVLPDRALIPAEIDILLSEQAGAEMENLRSIEPMLATAGDELLQALRMRRPSAAVILRWLRKRPDLRGWLLTRLVCRRPWGPFLRSAPHWILHYRVVPAGELPPGSLFVAARPATPNAPPQCGVIVYRDGGTFGVKRVESRELVVGRGDSETWVDLKFSQAVISRPHLLLRLFDESLEVMDVSRNGTLVNGMPVTRGEWVLCAMGDKLHLSSEAWIEVLPASIAARSGTGTLRGMFSV
jgi:hypothetical protein